ncbi:MAG: response regulator [Chloroflexota bacterium]
MEKKNKILVVDDDPGWCEELSEILKAAGYSVDNASSKELALDEIIKSDNAVVIVDLHLGAEGLRGQEFSGFNLLEGLQFLKSISFSRSKPIVLSAYGGIDQMRQAFKRGAYDFIQKQQFQKDEFLKIIGEAVSLWLSENVGKNELSENELEEYHQISRQFMRGKSTNFSVPDDARNPWAD